MASAGSIFMRSVFGVEILKAEGDWNAAANPAFNHASLPSLPSLLDAKINCRNVAGNIIECTVIECGINSVQGNYYVLDDGHGVTRRVTADELSIIHVD
jgi:hypothetical protein